MIVSLMVITMVSGGVLGLVYNLTKPAIDMVEANKNISAINEVLKTDKEIAEIKEVEIDGLTYNLAFSTDGSVIGAAIKTFSTNGFNGKI